MPLAWPTEDHREESVARLRATTWFPWSFLQADNGVIKMAKFIFFAALFNHLHLICDT